MKKENQPFVPAQTPARPRRRFLLACTTALAGLALLPLRALAESLAARFSVSALVKETDVEAAIALYTDGAEIAESTELVIRSPQIAENGNVVPVEVNATGVPGGVDQLAFFIANNPRPLNSVYHFGAAESAVSFRVRMLESTQVIAVARLRAGGYVRNSADVKVTSGGCGG